MCCGDCDQTNFYFFWKRPDIYKIWFTKCQKPGNKVIVSFAVMSTSVRFFRGIISANVQPQEVGSSNTESLLKPSRVGHDKMICFPLNAFSFSISCSAFEKSAFLQFWLGFRAFHCSLHVLRKDKAGDTVTPTQVPAHALKFVFRHR